MPRLMISLSFIRQSNNTVTGTQISSGIKPFAYIRNSTLTIRNLVPHSTIRLYDGTGRMMLNKNVSESDTYQIPLKSAGMYLIQIDTNTQSWKSKLVNN